MTIALLAGEGHLPLRVLEGIKACGERVVLLGIQDCCPEELIPYADVHYNLYPTELGRALKLCKKEGVKEIVFAGRFHHKNIYNMPWFKADFQAIKLWLSLKDKRADSMLKALAAVFEKAGIHVAALPRFLQPYLAPAGSLGNRALSPQEHYDVQLGFKVAKELGRLDVGQTVVIKKGAVIAVEAMEGTDCCIQRAADLVGEGLVVVKVAKPAQDLRFDLPIIGKNTIEKMIRVKGAVLAVQSYKTVIIDPEIVVTANKNGIALIAQAEV